MLVVWWILWRIKIIVKRRCNIENKKILLLVLLTGLFCGCGNSDNNNLISTNPSSPLNSNVEEYICESIEEEKEVSDSVSQNNSDLKISCDDFEINNAIDKELILSEDEEIEYVGWVEENEIFRIAIKRKEECQNEYDHVRDYFFIKKDDFVHTLMIDYPSKQDSRDADRYAFDSCDFCAEYIDVNSDNNKDLVIALGH